MYQNYIFDLYGTLVDIHTNEKKAYLWKKMSLFFGMKGAAYEPKELRMAYATKIKEQEAALGNGKRNCRSGENVPCDFDRRTETVPRRAGNAAAFKRRRKEGFSAVQRTGAFHRAGNFPARPYEIL